MIITGTIVTRCNGNWEKICRLCYHQFKSKDEFMNSFRMHQKVARLTYTPRKFNYYKGVTKGAVMDTTIKSKKFLQKWIYLGMFEGQATEN